MSVITELFENYDHIPLEFRRQLLMMRELDEVSNSKEVDLSEISTILTGSVFL